MCEASVFIQVTFITKWPSFLALKMNFLSIIQHKIHVFIKTLQMQMPQLTHSFHLTEENTFWKRRTLGGSEHGNTANNIAQHRITARKVNGTPSLQFTVVLHVVWWYKSPNVVILFKIICFTSRKSLKQTHHKSKTVVTLLMSLDRKVLA